MSKKVIARIEGGGEFLSVDAESVLARHSIVEVEPGVYSVLSNGGRSYEVRVHRQGKSSAWGVEVNGKSLAVEIEDPRRRSARGGASGASGRQNISAPMPGKVVRLLVGAGDLVEAGQGLVVVEAMKMQNEMKSPKAGRVAQILTEAGATVAVGDTLVVVE